MPIIQSVSDVQALCAKAYVSETDTSHTQLSRYQQAWGNSKVCRSIRKSPEKKAPKTTQQGLSILSSHRMLTGGFVFLGGEEQDGTELLEL